MSLAADKATTSEHLRRGWEALQGGGGWQGLPALGGLGEAAAGNTLQPTPLFIVSLFSS